MKLRKNYLFITCFFLFFSLTIFLVHQNGQLSRTAKNKEEEIKKLLKELKKSNLNQEEKPEESSNQKETDDLPWMFTWKGAIISILCTLITIETIIYIRYCKETKNCIRNPCSEEYNNFRDLYWDTNFWIEVVLHFIIFPLLFAIRKYKDKSYWQRLGLVYFSSLKTTAVKIVLVSIYIYIFLVNYFKINIKGAISSHGKELFSFDKNLFVKLKKNKKN